MGFYISEPDVPVVVTSLIFTTTAFLLVCTRMFTRVVMMKNPGADDYFMCAAMVSWTPSQFGSFLILTFHQAASIGFCVVIFYRTYSQIPYIDKSQADSSLEIKYGLGTPFETIPSQNLEKFFQVSNKNCKT